MLKKKSGNLKNPDFPLLFYFPKVSAMQSKFHATPQEVIFLFVYEISHPISSAYVILFWKAVF